MPIIMRILAWARGLSRRRMVRQLSYRCLMEASRFSRPTAPRRSAVATCIRFEVEGSERVRSVALPLSPLQLRAKTRLVLVAVAVAVASHHQSRAMHRKMRQLLPLVHRRQLMILMDGQSFLLFIVGSVLRVGVEVEAAFLFPASQVYLHIQTVYSHNYVNIFSPGLGILPPSPPGVSPPPGFLANMPSITLDSAGDPTYDSTEATSQPTNSASSNTESKSSTSSSSSTSSNSSQITITATVVDDAVNAFETATDRYDLQQSVLVEAMADTSDPYITWSSNESSTTTSSTKKSLQALPHLRF
jgi:hypothetical protein